jgi:hypothetical protein
MRLGLLGAAIAGREVIAASGAAVIGCAMFGTALAQEPRSLEYTDYLKPAETAGDRWWQHYWGEEREVASQQPSFAAHYMIGRDASRQAFAIFYSPRVCEDVRTVRGATLSRCPARFTRFYPSGQLPDVVNLPDYVCVVRVGHAPPPARDIGWNATQVTLRKIDGQHVMILSAVLAGELATECTTTIPLGPPG